VTGPSRAYDAGPGSLGRSARALGTVSRALIATGVAERLRDQPPRDARDDHTAAIREWPGESA